MVVSMDDRLKQLLRLVIEDVVETGEPVGSQRLVEAYNLEVSSATIRNGLVELEDEGYLVQPHTSAGRIPTEKGYRFYLSELMRERSLRQRELRNLRQAALMLGESALHIKQLAKIVADLAQDAVVLADPRSTTVSTGLSHLLAQPEFSNRERVMNFGGSMEK